MHASRLQLGVSTAVTDPMTKSYSGREGAYSAYSYSPSAKGSQGRNLEAGADAEAMEERLVFTSYSACFFTDQDHQPRGSTLPSELAPSPVSII